MGIPQDQLRDPNLPANRRCCGRFPFGVHRHGPQPFTCCTTPRSPGSNPAGSLIREAIENYLASRQRNPARWFVIGTLFNVLRILALGVVIGLLGIYFIGSPFLIG